MAERARSGRDDLAEATASATAQVRAKAADAVGEVADRVGSGDTAGAARAAKAAARDVAGAAGDAASDLKAAALDGGRQFIEDARDRATTFADRRKDDAAAAVSDFASSLRDTGKGFGERPNIQAFVSSAADGLDQLADGLKTRSFAELYGDVEDYARRSPATVGAVAVVAGFLLARFIKSSADDLSVAGATSRARAKGATARARPHAADL